MFGQMVAAGKLLVTQRALVRFYPRVGASVTRKFIRSGEPEETRDATLNHQMSSHNEMASLHLRFTASIPLAVQPRREHLPPTAVRPATRVRLLSGVSAEMGFKVAALGVHLLTTRVGAFMNPKCLCRGHSVHPRGNSFHQAHTTLTPKPCHPCNPQGPHCDRERGNLDILLVWSTSISTTKGKKRGRGRGYL